ncbi:hypothetical protein NM208_g9923 [Fusarium decemcellulare]|uniref:Uncharacterized protein n=1 Tax=Fusarium decemcellulare TaxID=57161 RepID=A0ACC1RZU2_9HYPO|nr:hypothetical protein NM208_g9923 [Fusarium decemcellulare]
MAPNSNVRSSGSASEESSPDSEGCSPLKRTPTNSSYYDFHGVQWNRDYQSQTWMYAREARNQMADVPPERAADGAYPSPFHNLKKLTLPTLRSIFRFIGELELLHYPLVSGRTTTPDPEHSKSTRIRAVYVKGTTALFDVIYHDEAAGITRNGTPEFSEAIYHPAHRVVLAPSPSTKNFPPLRQLKKSSTGA